MKQTKQSTTHTKTNSDFPLDIELLLRQGNVIRIKPQGFSMYPLFVPGRDEACIEQADFSSLKRSDVILYRRDDGPLVLHRIWKIQENALYLVGDNQTQIEGPLRADQLRGKLIGIIRNGHFLDVKNPVYRFLSNLWLLMRPFRPFVWKCTAFIRCRKPNHHQKNA